MIRKKSVIYGGVEIGNGIYGLGSSLVKLSTDHDISRCLNDLPKLLIHFEPVIIAEFDVANKDLDDPLFSPEYFAIMAGKKPEEQISQYFGDILKTSGLYEKLTFEREGFHEEVGTWKRDNKKVVLEKLSLSEAKQHRKRSSAIKSVLDLLVQEQNNI
jgi:hypothetical protein